METIILLLLAIIGLNLILSDINYQANQTPYYFLREVTHLTGIDTGHSNGYVVILNPNHPMYGIKYYNPEDYSSTIVGDIDIHGGITFSEYDENRRAWVIGFDVCHYGDTKQSMPYKSCVNETINLYNQVINYK